MLKAGARVRGIELELENEFGLREMREARGEERGRGERWEVRATYLYDYYKLILPYFFT